MIYIHKFDTLNEFQTAYKGDTYKEPWVSLTVESGQVDYNMTEEERLLVTPLTFEIESDGEIKWTHNTSSNPSYVRRRIDYRKNGGEWTSITSTFTGDTIITPISVVAGDVVQFRGNNSAYTYQDSYHASFSGTTCGFKVKGNIMSLISGTNFSNLVAFKSSSRNNFHNLFEHCTGLTDAGKLILPATTLRPYCYTGMFSYCTSLTRAPKLPAMKMDKSSYVTMFSNCSSLVTPPELPATGLSDDCYGRMFISCTSLETAPMLPAQNLASSCYHKMFSGCTSLTTAPGILATAITASSACTGMFGNCTSLSYIRCLATSVSSSSVATWVSGVAANGTFVKSKNMYQWDTGDYGIPRNWTVINE